MTNDGTSEQAHLRWQDSMSRLVDRNHYKEVWNRQAGDVETAKLAVAGHVDEDAFRATARDTFIQIEESIGLTPYDVILEIGCGVGRVGTVMADYCHHWIGTDISGVMLQHARERLGTRENVTLIELSGDGLLEVPSDSVDVVYCTIVFMHLYEWDRLRYVQEAFRVLRPGGRIFFDNVAFKSREGWEMLQAGASLPPSRRPAHMSLCSSQEEFTTYLIKSGFEERVVRLHPNGRWLGYGRKPVVPLHWPGASR